MKQVIRSPQASVDLWEIADLIARDSVDAALRFLDEVDDVLKRLADFPGLGRARDELHPGLRSLPAGRYVLFYRVTTDAIELVRVIHGARDLDRLFED
ncbi:MAG TPA: type II toxin-antitoxin system RelE/ParE family toxin [Tepidisphaeraceae bacterium]|nr:type II toxin-antitoxin system RelE/ParE family toxin [Tepidisphaeraceae bacterium]